MKLSIDTRHADTCHALLHLRLTSNSRSSRCRSFKPRELALLEAERPCIHDEKERSLYWSEVSYLEQLFEEDLLHKMGYSFVVVLQTVFETRLRAFFVGGSARAQASIGPTDLHNNVVDRASGYLLQTMRHSSFHVCRVGSMRGN